MFTLREEDGVYQGQCFSGTKSGFGVFQWDDGSWYEGEWRNNFRSGYGIFKTANGGLYSGLFKKNKLHEYGRCLLPNGDLYIGGWYCGRTHGYGVFYYADSNTFELSEFFHGKPIRSLNKGDGRPMTLDFVYTNKSESPQIHSENKFIGQVINGRREGKGVLFLQNGSRFEANWLNDLPNGVGVFYFSDDFWDVGNYEQGRLHGLGKRRFANGDMYFGTFSYGRMHGSGRFYSKQLDKWVTGEFCEDKCIRVDD